MTGLFANDVPVLCRQQGIPPIAVCSRYIGIFNNDDYLSLLRYAGILVAVLDLQLRLTLILQSKAPSQQFTSEVVVTCSVCTWTNKIFIGWLVTDTVAKIMLDALVSTKTLSSIQ